MSFPTALLAFLSDSLTFGVFSVKANASEDPKTQLTYTEMTAQMQSLTFAGHETTASTLSWMFWELAKHPEYQVKMRAEIRATRAAVLARGDTSFTIDDLDSMTSVMNAIKVHSHTEATSLELTSRCFLIGNASVPPHRLQHLAGRGER